MIKAYFAAYAARLRWLLLVFCLGLGLGAAVHAQAPDAGYWERTTLPETGLATFYAEGLMAYVHDYRLAVGDVAACPQCVGAVALLRAGDIGRKVWLQPPDGEPVGPFLVVDCARREDYPALLARGWVVDVSFEVGQLWGMTRPLDGVTVLEDPADALAGPQQPTSALPPVSVPSGKVVITAPTPTPAATVPAPTPWPPQPPVALGRALPTVTLPVATVAPPPLTPIITTPTPVVTPPPAEAVVSEPPVESAAALPIEAAVGRAGAGLLGEPTAAVPTVVRALTATPRAPLRTPRPDLTPILPDAPLASPTPLPAPPSALEQLWRALRELLP